MRPTRKLEKERKKGTLECYSGIAHEEMIATEVYYFAFVGGAQD